jgi:hypothetical protein
MPKKVCFTLRKLHEMFLHRSAEVIYRQITSKGHRALLIYVYFFRIVTSRERNHQQYGQNYFSKKTESFLFVALNAKYNNSFSSLDGIHKKNLFI